MPCICMGLEVGAEGAAAQPTEQQWLALVAFGSQFWTQNSICLKNFSVFTVAHGLSSWVSLFAGPALDGAKNVFRARFNTQAIYFFDLIWSVGGVGIIGFA